MRRDSLLASTHLKVCSRCIYDERVAAITFDAEGVCNYCRQIEGLTRDYGTGAQILTGLGLGKIRLLSNSTRRPVGLDGYGLEIVEQVSL